MFTHYAMVGYDEMHKCIMRTTRKMAVMTMCEKEIRASILFDYNGVDENRTLVILPSAL